ncbi:MAG: DUF2279 domain-containing protein [Calditrichia bacterium]
MHGFTAAKSVMVSPTPDLYEPSLDDGTNWTHTSNVKKSRLMVLVGGFLIGDAIGFKKIAELQYNTQTSSFHFHHWDRDIRVFRQMDKIGHVVESYYMSHFAAKIYRWSGFSARKSVWYGALTGLLWMTQIEVTDGFFANWGFSYLDYTANLLGCGYAVLQQFHPETLKGIRFKVSFWPSDSYLNGKYHMVSNSILDDYEGFTWWLAFNFHDLMPARWREGYPRWLSPFGLAIGYSIDKLAEEGNFGGDREVFIGLDFDITKIPTGRSKLLKFIKDELNFIRLPLPAVRLTPSTIWYGFMFSV